jgi:hypothetical protein
MRQNAAAFVARMIDRFDCERPAFPAIALTPGSALVSPFVPGNPEDLLARPLQALANPGDIVVFVASADHPSLQSAFMTARDLQCQVLILTSETGALRGPEFHCPGLPAGRTGHRTRAGIHELQLFVLHCCCDLIDNALVRSPR